MFILKEDGDALLQETNDKLIISFPRITWRTSAHITDGGNTTAQLTAPTGKTTADFGGGKFEETAATGTAADIATDEYREDEWSLQATIDALVDEEYEFRVLRPAATALDTYTVTPTVQITAPPPDVLSVFACGFEEGIDTDDETGAIHWHVVNEAEFSSAVKRTGAFSGRINSTGSNSGFTRPGSSQINVARWYRRFDSLPTGDCILAFAEFGGIGRIGLAFKASDSKLYAGTNTGGAPSFGATGVAITTGVWYRIDALLKSNANPYTVDIQVDGVACGQATLAAAADTPDSIALGSNPGATYDAYVDDFILSHTEADYPIGAGEVHGLYPNADGSHNISGANIFERGTTGTDITNATTTAHELVDEEPLDGGTPAVDDYVNQVANAATEYVEVAFEDLPAGFTPRAVEALVAHHQAGTGTGTSSFKLNDGGTEDTILARSAAGITTVQHDRKHYATAPSTTGAWTLALVNALKLRFGYSDDADPDQNFDGALLEVEGTPSGAPSGTAVCNLPSLTTSAAGIHQQTGTSVATLPNLTAVATGIHRQTGTAVITLPNLTAVVVGIHSQTGTSVATLPNLTAAASGNTTTVGPVITSVTPDIFADAESGVVIGGTSFGLMTC